MNRPIRILLCATCLTLLPSLGRTADKTAPAVVDALAPPPMGSVRFTGRLGRELETCRQGRMLGQSVADVVRPFAERSEVKFWQSEFWGKWFTSAALAYRYQPDAKMRAVLDEAVAGLLKTQTADGYIGNYKPTAETQGWDIWGRKYVLLGLLAYHDLTGDPKALAAAVREADYTLGQLGPGKPDIVGCGMWTGMAASSILEPMVLLYRRTGERRYLDFARYILTQWDTPKGPGLVTKALAGKSVYDMFPGPDPKQKGYMSGGSSKAYEMMSCYEGLLELYRMTGNPDYLEAVRKVTADIHDTEITIIGSGSSWERWCRGRTRQTEQVPEWMETCVTVTWLKLNAQLLRLTGEARYADAIEQTMYNSLIAAQKTDGTWWCHYNPLEGPRQPAPEQCNMHMNCCVANGPRGLMLLPTLALMSDRRGPVVNFYEPAEAVLPLPSGKNVTLKVDGDYPRSETVVLNVQPESASEFTLSLRIPAWSKHTHVEAAGQAIAAVTPGSYLRLKRTWQPGDKIRVTFDLTTRVVFDPGRSNRVALVRGPLVLAIDRRIPQDPNNRGEGQVVADAEGAVPAALVRQCPVPVYVAVDVPLRTADGKTAILRMCDYASAGHTWGADSTLRVWLPQPLDLSDPLRGVRTAPDRH